MGMFPPSPRWPWPRLLFLQPKATSHPRLLSLCRGFSTLCGTFTVGIGRKFGDPEYLGSPQADFEDLH